MSTAVATRRASFEISNKSANEGAFDAVGLLHPAVLTGLIAAALTAVEFATGGVSYFFGANPYFYLGTTCLVASLATGYLATYQCESANLRTLSAVLMAGFGVVPFLVGTTLLFPG
jgi:hypothetical protein